MLEEISLQVYSDSESIWSIKRLERVLAPFGFSFSTEPSSNPDTLTIRVSFDPLHLYTSRTRNVGRQKIGAEFTKEVYEEMRAKGYSGVQMMKEYGLSKKTFYRRKAEFDKDSEAVRPSKYKHLR